MEAIDDRRRRRFVHRSRGGCVHCKKKRQKCDEYRPQCGSCIAHAIECFYLETVPKISAGTSIASSRCMVDATSLVPSCEKVINLGLFNSANISSMRFGTPSTWSRLEVEGMHEAVAFTDAVTYRSGHTLGVGTYMLPYMVQHSFQSTAARHGFLAMRYDEQAQREKSSTLARLASSFKLEGMRQLRKELEQVDASNVEAILTAAMCLFIATSSTENSREAAILNAGADAAFRAVFPLTGHYPYGLPDASHFTISRIYLETPSLANDGSLIRVLASSFQHFVKTAAPEYPQYSAAFAALTRYHINMPSTLCNTTTQEAVIESAPSTLRIRPYVSASEFYNIGHAKAPFLILLAYFSITIVVSDVLRPDWVEGGEAQDLNFAYSISRVYDRLVDDGHLQWLIFMHLPMQLAAKFIETGTMLPPFDR